MESKDKRPHPLALAPYVQDLSLIGLDVPRYSQFATDSKAIWDIAGALLHEDLSGIKVLEAGCNSGVFAFLCAQRKAKVVGVDVVDHYLTQAESIKAHLNLKDEVVFKKLSVYEADALGEFDIVLALGLFYHLKFWLYALNKLASIAKELLIIDTELLSVKEDAYQARFVKESYRGDETNWWVFGAGLIVEKLKSLGFPNIWAFKVGGAYAAKEYATGKIDSRTLIPYGRRGLFFAVRDGIEPKSVVRVERLGEFEPLELGEKGIPYPSTDSAVPLKIFAENKGYSLFASKKNELFAVERFGCPTRIICEEDDKVAVSELIGNDGDSAPFTFKGFWTPKITYRPKLPSKPQVFIERADKIGLHLVFERALPPGTYVLLNVLCTKDKMWHVLASTAYYLGGKKSLKVELEKIEAASWDVWVEFVIGLPMTKPLVRRVKLSIKTFEHPASPLIFIRPSETGCVKQSGTLDLISPKNFARGDRIVVNLADIERTGQIELLWLDHELVPFGISRIEQADESKTLEFDTAWFPLRQGFLIVNRVDGGERAFLRSATFRCDQGKAPWMPDTFEQPFAGFAFKKVVAPKTMKTGEKLKVAIEYEYFPKDIWPMITIALYRESELMCKWDSWQGGLQLYQEGGHFIFNCPKIILAPSEYELLITAWHPTRGTFGITRKPLTIEQRDDA